VFVGDVIWFTIFSRNSSNLLYQFAHVHHQIFTVIYFMPRFFGSFIPKPWEFGFKGSGAAGHVSTTTYF
jgi:hypothetical protein